MLVLTMGGISSRFKREGYNIPKYLLKFGKNLILGEILRSYKEYIDNHGMLLIHNSTEINSHLVHKIVGESGLRRQNYDLLSLDHLTAGQAQTARLGVQHFAVTGEIIIVNADTLVRNWYGNRAEKPANVDGVIDVTNWLGDSWSFVLTDENGIVVAIEEKQRISGLTCTGTYHFSSASVFVEVQTYLERNSLKKTLKKEYYISDVYGQMLKSGATFQSKFINQHDIYLFGTPEEYKATCKLNGFEYESPS